MVTPSLHSFTVPLGPQGLWTIGGLKVWGQWSAGFLHQEDSYQLNLSTYSGETLRQIRPSTPLVTRSVSSLVLPNHISGH